MIYFIAGIVFALMLSPILDTLTALIMTALETAKAHITIQLVKYNKEIEKINTSAADTRVIGFTIPSEQEVYYDEDN